MEDGYYWVGGNISNLLQNIENSKQFLIKYGEFTDGWIYTLKIRSYYELGSYLKLLLK